MHNLHTIDLSIIFGYLAICLILGCVRIKSIKTIRDYAMGGKFITTPMLIGTLFATQIGAGATVGRIEKIHSLGSVFAIVILLSPLVWVTTYYVFANRIMEFKAKGCMTLSDVMEYMYGKPGRWITNITAKALSIAITSIQILAIGYLMSYFCGVSQIVGAMIGFGVLVIYSVLGGAKSIIITDAFQAIVLYIGIPAACLSAYYDVGGLDAIIASVPTSHSSFDMSWENISMFFSLAIWCWMPQTYGVFMQRFLLVSSKDQLKTACRALFFGSFPIVIVLCVMGYIVRVKAPDINSNVAFFYLIDHYLPVGVKGLVITGVLAAIMSTADSWLSTASILWAHDIWKKLFPQISDAREVLIARISLIIIAVLATFLAFFKNDSLVSLHWVASNFWDPITFVPLAMGFLGFSSRYKSQIFVVSSIIGVSFSVGSAYFFASGGPSMFMFNTSTMCIGLLGSFIGLVGTHLYLTRKYGGLTDKLPDALKNFPKP